MKYEKVGSLKEKAYGTKNGVLNPKKRLKKIWKRRWIYERMY